MPGQALFFLDYIATGQPDPDRVAKVVEGWRMVVVRRLCPDRGRNRRDGISRPEEYDHGFCVGVVDRSRMITGRVFNRGPTD